MAFTGREEHGITLADAAEMTARFRNTIEPRSIIGGFFGAVAIRRILDQGGCVGIRYYYGLNNESVPVLILVGVDADENDIADGELAEISLLCPNNCSALNDLNS